MATAADAASTLADLVTIHEPAAGRDRHIAVFYLHGGGLLYGERDDLPAPYVRAITDAGYTLVCADYPLCPEAALPEVVDAIARTWYEAVGRRVEAGELTGYFLFGRSAGAYLSLVLARELRRGGIERGTGDDGAPNVRALPQPLGILDFYGYYDLTDRAFREPARAYTALPEVTRATAEAMVRPAPLTSGPKPLRYSLYVYARQHEGAWLELMGLDGSAAERTAEAWSLSAEDIAQLPPLFIAASTGDEDVPLRASKTLARTAPRATMKTVYYLPHDFDRDLTNPAGMEAYRSALSWMDGLVGDVFLSTHFS
ncbi:MULTISPECIES: alpha/beta hydrolase [Enorma]|uniref:alpha/beta hydrolase n=1 Tax=Enorma TaxID=1472762 RepID=UPI00034B9664|nr:MULTISPECIES: alpha/beta hydrolase [Enorma]